MKFFENRLKIEADDAGKVLASLRNDDGGHFILESRDVSHVYGRLSLVGIDPLFELRGKNDFFEIRILNERGGEILAGLDFDFCDEFSFEGNVVKGVIKKEVGVFDERKRSRRKNVAMVIRMIMEKVRQDEKTFLGLYGAFAYDFVRMFEDLPEKLEDEGVHDFRLQFYDSFVHFDHLRGVSEVVTYRSFPDEESGEKILEGLLKKGEVGGFSVFGAEFDVDKERFKEMVLEAKVLMKEGEIFEVVLSNTLRGDFEGDVLGLYLKYREVNPSPYLFYFDFGDEQLVGASPEMMVRCENGRVDMRPISGTAKRGRDPIEDHENMLNLLNCEKERAELDMLIDLGRNDLARICKPGVKVSDYRFVEKYSKVMHTVAHVSGDLREGMDCLDALIACLNAGTLTGAPKVRAMEVIEDFEVRRRGYYGGTIGYITMFGEMDSGIIIRTAHIREGEISLRAGATLLYDSDPDAEYQECMNKAEAFLTVLK